MKASRKVKYIVNEKKRVITCILPGNIKDVYIGMSRCNPDDEWNEELGKDLARKRAIVKQCQDELEELPDVKYLDEVYSQLCSVAGKIEYWLDKMEKVKSEIASICHE